MDISPLQGAGTVSDPYCIEDDSTDTAVFGHRNIRKRTRDDSKPSVETTPPTKKFHIQPAVPEQHRDIKQAGTKHSIVPKTLEEALSKELGLIHIPVREDGLCCYTSMAKTVNLHALISGKADQRQNTHDIINHLKLCVNLLSEEVHKNTQLTKEVNMLLEIEDSKVSANQALKHLHSLFESYEKGEISVKTPELWGTSSMFSLLGLAYGYQINRYVFTASSKKSMRESSCGSKKPSLLCQVPEFTKYPEISHVLKNLCKGQRTPENYSIACHNLASNSNTPVNHFDVWITPAQAHTANIKLKQFASPASGWLSNFTWIKQILGISYFLGNSAPAVAPTDISTREINAWLNDYSNTSFTLK